MLRANDIPRVVPLRRHNPSKFKHNRESAAFRPGAERIADATGPVRSNRICAVIGVFLEAWREGLPDDERSILVPLFAKAAGTQDSPLSREKRAFMAADWLVRTHTPAWLELAGLREQARLLVDLPEITEMAQVVAMRAMLAQISQQANAEAVDVDEADWIKASDDCWATGWAAAFEAARLGAADPAWVSAAAASRAAAGLAARTMTRSTKANLKDSAAKLVRRMARPLG